MGKKGKSEKRENRKFEKLTKGKKSRSHQNIKKCLESRKSKKVITKENKTFHIKKKY